MMTSMKISQKYRGMSLTPKKIAELEASEQLMKMQTLKEEKGGPKTCRICLGDEEEEEADNPLIAPCKCTGTMGYLHKDCLREW